MLMRYLEKAVKMGANVVEIEYKDQKKWITAMKVHKGFGTGFGIGCLSTDEAKPLFQEFNKLKRRKTLAIAGTTYQIACSKYESFMEWVYRVEIKGPHKPAAIKTKKPSAGKAS
ncbi:MAG TPA: hypothetical protein VG488_03300 [Candidatus Angelobacter sp.]|jgi:hypothetical protein|nr:hypothetical protein [Candidatus Angelobacter sp.]